MNDDVKKVCDGQAVPFLLALFVWLILSVAWGLVGVAFGPGIMMLMVALLVAAVGMLACLVQRICHYQLGTLYSGLVISVSSVAVLWLFFSPTYQEIVFLAIFISIPSYLVSFLVDRFILLDKQ